ncbi:MAG: helix-turn-helix transcriptional regulator, partial [Chloroflexi bacterium]|nr:helix-turn-helix transcriptional regulator [Chloroflexota bacterium]
MLLVLDDYHLIHTRSIQEGMIFWLEHCPPHLRIILTSRIDPPLPLARLRVRGQLNEIRMADLRFTTEEAAQFLHEGRGLILSPGDVEVLESRTEGWIAGLQLAALALYASPARYTTFVAEFRGTHRHLIEYLTEEVWERQPEPVQQFLLHTALLERFCAPLCEAVLPM